MRQPRHFQEKLDLLRTVSAELDRMLSDGSFYRLSFANRSAWIRRVKKLYSGLRGPIGDFNLKPLLAAGTVSAAALLAAGCPISGGGGSIVPAFAASQQNPFGLTDVGYDAAPHFVDIDHDGDLDAFVGAQNGNTYYFENTGTASAPAFAAASTNPFGLVSMSPSFRAFPDFVDINNDGDLDAFIGADNGSTYYFENTGTASAPAFAAPTTNPFGLAAVSQSAAPCFIDIDNDGDLDAFIGNYSGDTIYFLNTGSASSPAFAAPVTNPFGLFDGGTFTRPGFADIDNDGDLDVFIGFNNENTYYFENTGSVSAPAFAASVSNPFGLVEVSSSFRSSPSFADIDNDGDLDAFIGYNDGNTYYFRNMAR